VNVCLDDCFGVGAVFVCFGCSSGFVSLGGGITVIVFCYLVVLAL
jgi:hypothetical protein